jgi:hypothetical protein
MAGFCRSGVAVYALKISVNAFLQDLHMNGDVFSLGVGQAATGRMAGKTILRSASIRREGQRNQEQQTREEQAAPGRKLSPLSC